MVNLNFLCFGLSPLLFIMPKMSMEKRLFPSFLFSADIYIFLFTLYHLSLYQNNPTSSKLVKVMFFTPDCFVFIPYIMPVQRQVQQEGIILRDGGGNSVFYKKMLLKWCQSFSTFFFFQVYHLIFQPLLQFALYTCTISVLPTLLITAVCCSQRLAKLRGVWYVTL